MSDEMEMSEGMGGEITDDDKLWAALAYILTPLVPIIILLMEDKKERPFIKAHNMQALVLGLISMGVAVLLGWLVFPLCLNMAIFIYAIFLGIKAYQGEYVTIPVITDLVKGQS